MSLADTLRWARALGYKALGLNALARRRLDGDHAIILNYHRVLDRSAADRDAVEQAMFVTPESFSLQLEVLRAHFNVLPLSEISSRILEGRALPKRACAITFDDGWKDNFDWAFPALAKAGLPATIFVVTGRVGTLGAFWPDEILRRMRERGAAGQAEIAEILGVADAGTEPDAVLAAVKALDDPTRREAIARLPASARDPERELMDWDELARLDRAGIEIESHGSNHEILPTLSDDAVRRDVTGARQALAERGLGRANLFAYPSGRFDTRVAKILADTGHRAAFTVVGRSASRSSNPMEIPRRGVHDGMGRTPAEFLAKIPGWD